MPNGAALVTKLLQHTRQIEVRIRIKRIGFQTLLIGFGGLFETAQLFERDTQVERGGHVIRYQTQRLAVMLQGGNEVGLFVKHDADVHVLIRGLE